VQGAAPSTPSLEPPMLYFSNLEKIRWAENLDNSKNNNNIKSNSNISNVIGLDIVNKMIRLQLDPYPSLRGKNTKRILSNQSTGLMNLASIASESMWSSLFQVHSVQLMCEES